MKALHIPLCSICDVRIENSNDGFIVRGELFSARIGKYGDPPPNAKILGGIPKSDDLTSKEQLLESIPLEAICKGCIKEQLKPPESE